MQELELHQIEHIPVEQSWLPYGAKMHLCKVITAGNKQQFFNYPKPQFTGYQVFRTDYTKDTEGVKSQSNLQRTRNSLVLLIDANVTPFSKFITLTFAKPVLDREEAFAKLKQFIKDFKRKFGYLLEYVCVAERQKKRGAKEGNEGSWHFHLVVFNEAKLPFKQLKSIWGKYGSIDIKKVDSVKNLGIYMAKYLTKEEQELNKKGFTSSHNLQKPTIEYLPYNYIPNQASDYSNTYPLYNPNNLNSIEMCSFDEYHTPQRKPIDIVELAQSYFGVDKVEVVK